MAIFNPQFFINPLASLNTAFGIPTCMLSLGAGALGLIDSQVLTSMAKAAGEGQAAARKAIGSIVNGLFASMGILDYDTATGKLSLFAESSKFGLDLSFLDELAKVTGALSEMESLANQGIALYEEIANCLGEFKDYMDNTGPSPMTGAGGMAGNTDQYSANTRVAALGLARQQIEQAIDFSNQCQALKDNIGVILFQRQTEILEDDEDEPIFRLVFGPPVSKKGLFILSEDGIYYDSQERLYNGKHIPSASDVGFILDSEKWELDHAPNLGGKGTLISAEILNRYVDTIFDINHVDNTKSLQAYYDADHFLNVLISQKTKQVYDVSGEMTELLESGFTMDSAMMVNHRHSLNSVVDTFNKQIDKRKKQIEVAVKSVDLFGSEVSFAPGEVPVNDFSFLSSINLNIDLETQRELTFDAGDVDEVVLPIEPLFVANYGGTSKVLIDPLVVPPVGKGSIVFSPSVSSTTAPALSLTDAIVSDELFSIYNFLRPQTQIPASREYKTLNCATLGTYGDAQLVGKVASVFTSGLAIPFLGGVAKFNQNTYALAKTNNYLRLPPTDEFMNLLYTSRGCSMECWLHIPNYGASANNGLEGGGGFRPYAGGAWGDYNYYKILLANENMGGALKLLDVSSLVDARGSNTTRGLLIGFTRDPVMYSENYLIPGSNTDPGANHDIAVENTSTSSCFFIAPTMAFSPSSVEFIPNIECANEGAPTYNKFIIRDDTEVNGKQMRDVSAGFVHLNITFDVSGNKCVVYLDGTQMASSSLTDVFGSEATHPPRVPTFLIPDTADGSSFYYSNSTVNQHAGSTTFSDGPANDTYFTPWIVGGGWTDGFPINSTTKEGGFMGLRHGLTSGLNGFVGSLKFYSKPLSNSEVIQNYNAQKGLFKNIQV